MVMRERAVAQVVDAEPGNPLGLTDAEYECGP